MSLRQAAQQALEALMKSHTHPLLPDDCEAAITALRAALAEPEQEPVECDCLAKNMPFGRCCKACAHGIGEQHE